LSETVTSPEKFRTAKLLLLIQRGAEETQKRVPSTVQLLNLKANLKLFP